VTDQHEGEPESPHILIVDQRPNLRGRLGQIFKNAGISYEGVEDADSAVEKLTAGNEPPITGVLTGALMGDYPRVVEASREAGVNVALMTQSSLTRYQAQGEGIAAYPQSRLTGEARHPRTIKSMIAELVPPPTA
jgi:CheY-like chemotaxis protein